MPEPTEAVVPILRRIQADLAGTRRELGRKIEDNADCLDSIESYLTHELGMTTRARADIKAMKLAMKSVRKRLAALERSSSKGGSRRKR